MNRNRTSDWHLKRININSYGKLQGVGLGPFAPGMNVVFGKNESGKTTLTSFVTGVLFGWPDGRSQRNTYKPENADRSGSLVFARGEELTALARFRNSDGVNDEEGLLDDIDAATYDTVFALDGDELMALDDTTEVTSRLLTAGAGTNISPVSVLAQLDARIASYTSRAAGAEHSITNLKDRLEVLDTQLAKAEDEARSLMHESREYDLLEPARAEVAREHDELNALIEGRRADLSLLQKLDDELVEQQGQRESLVVELSALDAQEQQMRQMTDEGGDLYQLASLSAAQERELRDELEDLQADRERLANAFDFAKRNHADSAASYEVLSEQQKHAHAGRHPGGSMREAAAWFVLPLVALLVGIPLLVSGDGQGSPPVMVLGVLLTIIAVALGARGLVVTMRRRGADSAAEQAIEDARRVLLEDEKKLAACEEDLSAFDDSVESFLQAQGLSAAHGSLRRARSLLDDARDSRASGEGFAHRRQGILDQIETLDQAIEKYEAQRAELLEDAGVEDIAGFEALVNDACERRDQLMAESEQMDTRSGELAQRLSQARHAKRFAQLKQERASLRCRLKESKRDLARLLIARRNLSDAVAAWESQSQPQVYRLASRLFEDMTEGAWREVRLNAAGDIAVIDDRGDARDPQHLSLGTRQQLYLALRIALLMTAENVGRAVPVLADDILVNFDAERRRLAARALVELACKRQVILFTCHEEVVALIGKLDAQANVVRL